jgi:hypothetical protein
MVAFVERHQARETSRPHQAHTMFDGFYEHGGTIS